MRLWLEAVDERRELISGALQKVEYVVDQAGHDAGVSAHDDNEAYHHYIADCSAHGYRSRPATCIRPPAAIRVRETTAMCSLLAQVAVALETGLM
jgi:hypothetical protein